MNTSLKSLSSLFTVSNKCCCQNFCSNSTVLRTRTACHSCSISALIPCPSGFRQTPRSVAKDCNYYIRTISLKLPVSGCSFECYREEEVKSCCPGYWGPDCVECPDRADRPCSNRGVCSDGLGGNGTCTSCSCVHGLCDSGVKGDGRCTCFSGYKGPNCDQGRSACYVLPALFHQFVYVLPCCHFSSLCSVYLSRVTSIPKVCHVHASCVHTGPNQHLCACNEGYSGDGRVCMAIDPCQTERGGCSARSTRCVYDGPGKSHCECLPGFENLLNGVCSMKDSCRPDSCDRNANCTTVGPGRVECNCLQGYLGNGKVCYGNIMQRLSDLNTEPRGQWTGQLTALSWPLQNLGPFTIFVPINKGFKGISVRTLTADVSKAKYLCKMHLVAGVMPFDTLKKTNIFYTLTGKSFGFLFQKDLPDSQTKIRIHGSRKKGVIIQSDLMASNGMIHIINKLMDSVSPTFISNYGKFDKFKSLLEKTDLAAVMDLPGPITVFAPCSVAFDEMTDGHLQYLSSPEGHNKLVELMRNHIVPSTTVRTFFTFQGQILVNGAAVLEAAVEAKNGRLYVLDRVLIPASIEPVLPHRCDSTETSIIKVRLEVDGSSTYGCVYSLSIGSPPVQIPATGCSPLCNITVTTPACCKGFYGPDCSPCPGGYQTPCSGHGQCLGGIEGNGSCVCNPNFSGSRCQYCASSNKYGPNCDKTCPCIHGQCDNRPDSDGRCKLDSCQKGFTGRFCDRQTAACGVQVQFCHAHADSQLCANASLCPLQAKCVKTGPGSHSCQCLSGWREDGDECQPINNCNGPDRGSCHPNATCIYVGPGQSDCSCKAGYKGNGQECEPVNQCVTENGGCHYWASCLLRSSRWTCVCDEGYVGNGRVCYGTVEQVRLKLVGNYPISSLNNISSVTSLLKTTFPLSSNREVTSSLISAQRSPLSCCQVCSRCSLFHQLPAVGGATITTADLAATNGLIHVVDKVLVPDRKLSEGLLATLALRPEFSLFRSYLIDYNLTDEIEQVGEFSIFAPTDVAITDHLRNMAAAALDVNTTRYHVVPTRRLLKTDLQLGGYKQTMLGFSFQLGIFPRDGKLFVNNAQLNSTNILSGKGVIHGLSAVLHITRNRCDEAANQKVMVSSADTLRRKKCMFTGRPLTGFFGEHCEPCPGPKGQPCFGNGACLDGTNGTGVCQCSKGFEGTACETCQSGKYGVHCDQDCRCKNGRCSDGTKGDGTCDCDVGWRGVVCDESTTISEHCVIRPSGPQCLCAAGFEGNGTFCQAKDPCLVDNGGCSLYAVCKRTLPGLRDCVCNRGYAGDGLVCVEINPCLEGKGGCHVNADCVHTGPNKTSCVCSEGYSGDGQNCEMINLCRKGFISVNEANVTYSDGISINGIFHEINKILFPPALNLTDVAERDGYKTFYKLLEDTGVMNQVNNEIFRPVTVFLPSDGVMASLPQEQKDFLFHQHNRPQLVEYLKFHVLQNQKIYAEGLIHLESARTLQGSPLSFTCGGTDRIGEIFVNDGNCRIVQRHLVFNGGIAYGIDCLLTPPSLGGRCDEQTTFDLKKCDLPTMFVNKNSGCRSICTINFWQPKCCHGYYGRDCLVCPGGVGSLCNNRGKCDDGHLGNGTCTCDAGFRGVACELCSDGFYGPTCKACNCSEHGSCDDGHRGTGLCFCEPGWTGERCDKQQAQAFECSPSCSPKAVCKENNTCVCRPFYEGDGFTCTVVDVCQFWNGGCAKGAKCSPKGEKVSCTCPKGHTGDGFTCQPIDPCASGDNGGCHEHATCTMTAPGKKKCTCKDNYIGDGVTCEVKRLPISRCLQDNGQCHDDAKCTDLHFEDATLGVFHYRSDQGQYKLNYSAAQQACTAEGGSLATYNQLSYAQQGGLNMCAAGWLDGARVAYPTTYSNPKCGFGHVGIVDYGIRNNLSETWDTFCYRMKEVKCECKLGYVGDGFTCTGNLLQVLRSTPTFSNFLTQILNYSQVSESGKQFVKRLSTLTVQSTLFVPENSGLSDNQTLSQRDIEFHLSEGQALPLDQLKNGSRIKTRVGSLTSSRYINGRFVTDSDIPASNGIIHILQAPLKAPPPHQAGMGVGVVLLVVLVVAVVFVGYHFYTHNTKPFQFHYFKVHEC
uniref:Uncharacterized protein n=1 Tax=Anabas testudineus TaxID=64144 RepID=A0A3Q1H6M0_ANATE